ncbi:PTS fructose transporter subunit IIA [Methylophilaceae bacterium]|jgi:mannose/fructose-specific phosphotransferase system component IIA|nr:PTS fructose transporter subunit IIA [Nitrosomonadales bacterium]MCH9782002.1 PTS fructose transporter subunit IIA [Betaproteobacteria bacterium]MDA7751211.1 PTS fructose transporter subunit IIA [Methylophilaceae bacterium]MCH9842323.1 PTS fructose transporter subunit IIA [Betaproteobacteria bacterium]MDA9085740.1 PTS fructose transporter subunit IIA [Methylophilaceae bacterium]
MIGILIVTHGDIGLSLLKSAAQILGKSFNNTNCISVESNHEIHTYKKTINSELLKLNSGKGVLIMSDMYGATPTNILKELVVANKIEVLTGINLPMLVQALTNRDSELKKLISDCLKCGKDSVINLNDHD